MISLAELWIYPIKSCQGISLKQMQILKTGPAFDRQWMIVDENNQFITLRTVPKLSQIKTQIDQKKLYIHLGNHKLETSLYQQHARVESVTVQDQTVVAGIESDLMNESLSDFLNQKVRLVKYQNESFRPISETAISNSVIETTFTDDRPVLMTNMESLKHLNQNLEKNNCPESMMNRFRPNIVITGLEAYQEEYLKKLRIGQVEFIHPKLCGRCVIITMDAESGKVVSNKTLKYLPRHEFPKGPKIVFGQYLTPANLGMIQISDQCDIEYTTKA
jgi:uncharacterized protein YcbX